MTYDALTNYVSAKDTAKKWNISQRRVAIFCAENRVSGATKIGNMWIIPANAVKPKDNRTIRYAKSSNVPLKPFVKWAGGKGQLVDQIKKYLPKNGRDCPTKYAEPFVGGGAVLFHVLSKYNFSEVYIGDTNAELINTYTTVKENVLSLIATLDAIQSDYLLLDDEQRKKYYYDVRDKFNSLRLNARTSVQKAAYFIFLNKTCFNGLYRVNRKGLFNVPMGTYKKPTICDKQNLLSVSVALKNVTIKCCDFSKSQTFVDSKTLVYLDPPYRPLSQTANFTAYSPDCFDDFEQLRLADFSKEISARGAKVILSNSDPKNTNPNDDFFEQLYSSYQIHKIEATRMINSNADKRGKINELLICNY